MIDVGEVLFISHRRLFQHDEARYFLGRIVDSDGVLVKVMGYSFVRDLASGYVVKKAERRTKLLSLSSPGFIVYELPQDVDIDDAEIRSGDGEAILVDGNRELMNLAERTHCGHF